MKILISILSLARLHPPSPSAVDVMSMSVCQSNDCSFSGCLALNENGNFPPITFVCPSTHQSSSSKIYELSASESGRQMKYRQWANICDAEGAWFDSEAKRNEVSPAPCSMPHSKQAKSMGRHPSAPARHSGLKCIGKRFPKNIFIFKKNKCKLPLSFISLC